MSFYGNGLALISISASPIVFLSFDESSHELKVARVYRFQNNRSSAPPIVMMDGEASAGYLLFWLIYTCYLEANDEMRIMIRKMMGRSFYFLPSLMSSAILFGTGS